MKKSNKKIRHFFHFLMPSLLAMVLGMSSNLSFGQCNAIGSTAWNAAGTWNSCGGAFPTAANQVVVTGFTVTLPSSQAGGNLAGSGTVSSSAGSNILSIGSALANTTFSGIIQNGGGTTGITKVGSNTQTFSGTNTYTGVTTINAGILSVATIGNGGSSGNLGQASNAAGNLVLGGGTLQYTGATASTDRNFTLTAATTSSIDVTTNTLTISGAAAATTGSLTKIGSGTLILSGSNAYTGITTINAGVLSIGSINNGGANGPLGAASNNVANLVLGGGTLQYTGGNGSSDRAFTLTTGTTSSIEVTNSATTLTMSGASGNSTNGILTKIGSGTLELSGANTYTGATNINAGTLKVSNANSLGSTAGGAVVASGATLDINNVAVGAEAVSIAGTGTSASVGALSVSSGTSSLSGAITMTAASSIGGNGTQLTLSGAIGGAFALTKQGTSTLILSNTGNNYGGATTITDGTLKLGAAGVIPDGSAVSVASAKNFDLAGFAETVGSIAGAGNIISSAGTPTLTTGNDNSTTTFSGAIQNSIALTKSGTGTLTLSGNNSYSGATVVNTGGTLSLGSSNALGNTSSTTVNSGGALDIVGGININKNISIAGTGVSSAGALTGTGAGTSTMSGTVTMTAASSMGGSGTLTVSGAVSGAFDLTKVGSGTLTLSSGSNSYSGNTIVSAGTLRLGANNAIPSTSSMTMSGTSVLDMNGNSTTITSLTGSASTSISGSGTLTTNSSSNTTMAGALQGTFNMVKTGSGTLTLSGTNTNTGTLTITKGGVTLGTGASLASNVLLNGGTLTGGSSAVSMGTFTPQNSGNANGYTSNSTIALGSGNLSFSGAGGTGGGNWNNSFVTVTGWTGGFNGTTGTGGKLTIGGTALTAAQLLLIRFYNSSTGGYYPAIQLGTGEVVPNTLASASPSNCNSGVPAAPSIPACGTLTSLSGTAGPGNLANDTKYVWSTASSCATSGTQTASNINNGNANTEIYVMSGETLNISDFSMTGGKIYVMSGATLNISGNINNSGSIYVYGTLNLTGGSVGLQSSNAIYVASTGIVNVTGTLNLNSGNIVVAGALNVANTSNWASSVICHVDGGCTKLSATGGLTNNNANLSANVGTLYWPNTTCPGSPADQVSNSASFTMDPNTIICTGQTNPSNNPTSTQCAFWGAAKVVWGCTPAPTTCAGAIALPTTLAFFQLFSTNEGVLSKWGTISQWDSDYFIVEKSQNGIDWEYVTNIPAKNEKLSYKEFSFTDTKPYTGDSYYHLVEVDVKGKRTVYATDFIHNDKMYSGFSVYPNPTDGQLNVNISGEYSNYDFEIIDVTGKQVYEASLNSGLNKLGIVVSNSGIYFVKLRVGLEIVIQKLVVR